MKRRVAGWSGCTGSPSTTPDDAKERVRGEPVYLIAAMTTDKVLRLKPQNLIAGLAVRRSEVVS